MMSLVMALFTEAINEYFEKNLLSAIPFVSLHP